MRDLISAVPTGKVNNRVDGCGILHQMVTIGNYETL